jgi:hypothetical protein
VQTALDPSSITIAPHPQQHQTRKTHPNSTPPPIKVFLTCLEVMAKYDPDLSFIDAEQIHPSDMENALRKAMIFFLQRHPSQKGYTILKFLS